MARRARRGPSTRSTSRVSFTGWCSDATRPAQASAETGATEYAARCRRPARGVPVPRVRALLADDDGLGRGLRDGPRRRRDDPPPHPARRRRTQPRAPALAAQCGDDRGADPRGRPGDAPGAAGAWARREQIEQYRALLDALRRAASRVRARAALARRPRAADAAPSRALVHGDFRNGNFIVGPDGIRAVLDWELAHLGDPIEDLGWLCVKSWRFGDADQLVGGFGDVAELLAAYEARGRRGRSTTRRVALLGRARHAEVGRDLRRARRSRTSTGSCARSSSPTLGPPRRRDGMGPARPARRRLVTMTQDRPTAAELVARGARVPRARRDGRDRGPRAVPHPVAVNALGMIERELDARPRASRPPSERGPPRCSATTATPARSSASSRPASGTARSTTGSTRCAPHVRATVREKLLVANPGYLPADAVGLASTRMRYRDLERQLAEGAAPPRRGVPRLRRRRRAVPAGDEARRQGLPRADVLRRSATSRCTTARASGTASRSCRVSASTIRHQRLRRRARRSLRRRRARPRGRRAAACASSACTCRTAARSAPTSTSASCAWLADAARLDRRDAHARRPARRARRLQRRARRPRRVGPEEVRRRDARDRARAQGRRRASRSGASRTCSAACTPTPTGCSATGTTAPATSTSTAACASTSCSRPRPSPNASPGPSSTATPARAPVPSDHAPVIVDLATNGVVGSTRRRSDPAVRRTRARGARARGRRLRARRSTRRRSCPLGSARTSPPSRTRA